MNELINSSNLEDVKLGILIEHKSGNLSSLVDRNIRSVAFRELLIVVILNDRERLWIRKDRKAEYQSDSPWSVNSIKTEPDLENLYIDLRDYE